jgi:ABC-type branched-subunit amino acid transport system substrate-binding protein
MARDIERRAFLKRAGAAGVLGTVGLSGCVGGGGEGGDGREVSLGILLPETGDLASVGQPMIQAAQLPVMQVNDSNPAGISVNAQTEDTQTSPSAGVSAAESLIGAGVPSVCGTASSGVNVPVSQQVFIPNEVVGCSPSSTALSVTNLDDNDYIFRTAPSDFLQGRVMAQVMAERLEVGSVSTLFVNNDYGQQLSDRFTSVFTEEYDGEVFETVGFNKGASSYSSAIETALSGSTATESSGSTGTPPGSSGPEGVVVIGYPESGIQLFRDYYSQSDGSEEILVPDGLRDGTMPGQVGNDMANVTGTAPAAGGPSQEAFNSLFQDEYGESPGVFTSQSYDSVAIQILANAAAGENDGTAVRDQMRRVANPEGMTVTPDNLIEGVEAAANGEEVNYQGASSATNFDENGDPASAAYAIWEFADEGTSQVSVQNFEGENPEGSDPTANNDS